MAGVKVQHQTILCQQCEGEGIINGELCPICEGTPRIDFGTFALLRLKLDDALTQFREVHGKMKRLEARSARKARSPRFADIAELNRMAGLETA